MSAENARVRVLVRSRPLPDGSTGAPSLKSDPSQPGIVVIRAPAPDGVGESTEREFLLDDVIMGDTRHEDVFERGCREHVDHVMEGFNACVFAYGQTGSGKTYTVFGNEGEKRGIMPRSAEYLFKTIKKRPQQKFAVFVSFLEIYLDKLRDLAADAPSGGAADGDGRVEFKGATKPGSRPGQHTLMNEASSRSHTIVTLTVVAEGKSPTDNTVTGRLNIVDLAGCERLKRSLGDGGVEDSGLRAKEAVVINKSLSSLGNVVMALASGQGGFVSFRDSKLTRLLQDSLGGNSYTTLVATVNPREIDAEESLNTLQFANRCRNVQTQPHVNYLDADSASQAKVIDKLMKEIAALKDQLSSQKDHYENRIAGSAPPPKSNTASPEDRGGGTPGAVSVSEAADDAKSRGTSRGSARRGEGKPARSSTADQNALSEAQAISRDLKEKFNKKNMEFRAAQEAARRNEERLKRDIDEYRGKVSTVSEDMQQTVQQLKIGKHEEAQRYEREMDLLKEHNNKLLNDMDNALRSVPERLRVDTSRIKETEARVAGIKEEMHTEMTKDNKKAAEDQTKNLELQRAQYEFWLKKKTDELAVFVEQFDQYKIDKTKQINALENNAIYLFDYSNKLATLIANYEKGNYPVYEKAGIKAIAFPDKDKPDAMMVDTIKEVLKYKKRADDFVRGRPTGLEASFTEETPAANLRGATAASGAGSQAQKGAGGGDADVDALERQLSAARLKLDVAERQVADQGSDSRAKIEQEVLADLADHPTVEYIKRIEDERTYYKELLHEETRRCKDLRVALDAKQRALDKTAQVGQLSAMARSGVGGQRLGNTKVAASASGMAIGSRAT
ncbi:P-loop containing nucleoside triphosphate hydrolase protein [Baffinella frigidus]|nr:P-loop containing nucleoside triphosphate hydrolase protein [Cryptophyta sp. CCMP2293]